MLELRLWKPHFHFASSSMSGSVLRGIRGSLQHWKEEGICLFLVVSWWLPVYFLCGFCLPCVTSCLLPGDSLSTSCVTSVSWCVDSCLLPGVCVCVCSVMSNSLRLHGLQPTRSLCPWDVTGKNTGWVAISFYRGSSWPRDRTQVCFPLCHLGSPETSCFSPWPPGFLPEVSESISELGLRILRKGMGWLLSVYWVGEVRLILTGIKLDTRTNHYHWGEKSPQGKTIRRASKTEGSTPFSLFLPFSLLSSLQLIKSNMAKKRYFSQSLSPISQSSTKKSRFRVERPQLTNWHKCFTK